MDFFGRKREIGILRDFRDKAETIAQFIVLTGRRRVGKTELVRKALDDGRIPYLHLTITRQPERTLCLDLQNEVEQALGAIVVGQATRFSELFEAVVKVSLGHPMTVVLDEFQEFDRMNPGVFGAVQRIWDKYHSRAKLNLVICGSVNRLMEKIFFSDAEPLYGRNTGVLELKPFRTSELKEILGRHRPNYRPDDLLSLWTVSGGVARYVNLLVGDHALTRKDMLASIFREGSSWIDEGRTVLADEFGPDYGTYFTILSAIAGGRTSSSDIKNLIGAEVGGFLSKLEDRYRIVSKKQPIFERTVAKNCHYQIDDCFFRFWFRFVFRHRSFVELGRYDRLLELAERDFDTFSGYALERYFLWKFRETTDYTRMGAWWDRKGENEIDLVCEDEFANKLDFFEIKRDSSRFEKKSLEAKAVAFFEKNPDKRSRVVSFGGLSLNDL